METGNEIIDRINKYLNKEEGELWVKYLSMKSRGVKKAANTLLNEFTEKLTAYPFEKRRAIVYELLALSKEKTTRKNRDFKFLEEQPKLKIQHQLIEKIIFPVLVEDFKNGQPGAAKALSSFEFMFYTLVKFEDVFPEIPFPKDWGIGEFFLKTELENNPEDREAATLWLNRKIRKLDYDTHELPRFGLLVNIELFEEGLNDLAAFIQKYKVGEEFKNRIEIYELIRWTWKDYSKNHKSYKNYSEYLEINQVENREKI